MSQFPIPYLTDPDTGQVRIKPRLEQAFQAGARFLGEELAPVRTKKDMLRAMLVGGVGLALRDRLDKALAATEEKTRQD